MRVIIAAIICWHLLAEAARAADLSAWLERTQSLFEKRAAPERIAKLKANPPVYRRYLEYLNGSGNYAALCIRQLNGYCTAGAWGDLLVREFSGEAFSETWAWREHPSPFMRLTILSILRLYVENPKTPDRTILDDIMPYFEGELPKTESVPGLRSPVEQAILAKAVRFAGRAESVRLLKESIETDRHAPYALKLASIMASPEAIEMMREYRDKGGRRLSEEKRQAVEISLEIGALNAERRRMPSEEATQLETAVLDASKKTETRIYALCIYNGLGSSRALRFISETRKRGDLVMSRDLKKALEDLDPDSKASVSTNPY
jgi:hypothetical protein